MVNLTHLINRELFIQITITNFFHFFSGGQNSTILIILPDGKTESEQEFSCTFRSEYKMKQTLMKGSLAIAIKITYAYNF